MTKIELAIINDLGLHIRASDKLVRCASAFVSEIEITFNNKSIDSKRILQVMSIGAIKGDVLSFAINGPDESLATKKITELLESGFGEINETID